MDFHIRATLGHPLSMYAKFSGKLTFLTPWYAHVRTCVYQGVRNVSFLEHFAHVLNGWPPWKLKIISHKTNPLIVYREDSI